jgi:hypothetical protein
MLPGEDKEGVPVLPDEFEQHDSGLELSSLRGRDSDDVHGIDGGADLAIERFDAERKTSP